MRVDLTPIEYGISLFFYAKGDKKMKVKSKITGKEYMAEDGIYISNMLQARLYLIHLGSEALLDILYDSQKRPNSIVFVFERGEKTRQLKRKWDEHTLTEDVD